MGRGGPPRISGLDGPAIAGVPDRRGPVPSDHAAERHPSCSSLNGSGDKAVPERPHSEVARDPPGERVLARGARVLLRPPNAGIIRAGAANEAASPKAWIDD